MPINLSAAIKFNATRPPLTPEKLALLIADWQEDHDGLDVDGMLGGLTLASIDHALASYKTTPLTIQGMVVRVAMEELGKGESEANNKGPDIRKYAAPNPDGGEWCAYFAGWCWEEACRRAGVPMPFSRSPGAKRIVKNMGSVGRMFTDPFKAKPGDLLAWHRGLPGSWSGHVGIVINVKPGGIVDTIEGNTGAYPSKVRKLTHDVRKERFFSFASIDR